MRAVFRPSGRYWIDASAARSARAPQEDSASSASANVASPPCACGGGCPRCKAAAAAPLAVDRSDGAAERDANRAAAIALRGGNTAVRARRVSADPFRDKFSGSFAKGRAGDEELVLLKPMTFMNLSGQSVQPAAAFFKVAPSRIIVVHDEIDLPFADVRLKVGGGHAGHNGLRSILGSLGTPDFVRVRVGVGRPGQGFRGEVADYVLSSFDASERAELQDVLSNATDSVLDVLARGTTAAMNKLNTKAAKKAKSPSASVNPASASASTSSSASSSSSSESASRENTPRSGGESRRGR